MQEILFHVFNLSGCVRKEETDDEDQLTWKKTDDGMIPPAKAHFPLNKAEKDG